MILHNPYCHQSGFQAIKVQQQKCGCSHINNCPKHLSEVNWKNWVEKNRKNSEYPRHQRLGISSILDKAKECKSNAGEQPYQLVEPIDGQWDCSYHQHRCKCENNLARHIQPKISVQMAVEPDSQPQKPCKITKNLGATDCRKDGS